MHGEWVVVNLGDGVECRVWVTCVPRTPDDILQRRALDIIQSRLQKEKKNPMAMYADAMQKIEEYEYSQGRGQRDAEQAINELMKEYGTQ